MAAFNIDRFEQRLSEMLRAYETLQAEHAALQAAHAAEKQRNAEVRDRLSRVIERIRALEIEAEAGDQSTRADQFSSNGDVS